LFLEFWRKGKSFSDKKFYFFPKRGVNEVLEISLRKETVFEKNWRCRKRFDNKYDLSKTEI